MDFILEDKILFFGIAGKIGFDQIKSLFKYTFKKTYFIGDKKVSVLAQISDCWTTKKVQSPGSISGLSKLIFLEIINLDITT